MLVHVRLHHLREDVREHEQLTGSFVGMREVSEHLADELAIHFALGIAHLFVTHGDASLAHAQLQLVDDGKHRLSAGRASVFHGLDGLALEPRCTGHQAGQQALLIQREIAGGPDAAHVQDRCRAPTWRQAP